MARRTLRYLPLVVVVLLLAVAAVVANASGPRVGTVPRPESSSSAIEHTATPAGTQSAPAPLPHGHRRADPTIPAWAFIVLAAALVALGYGAVLLYLMLSIKNAVVFRRRRRGEPDEVVEVPEGPSQDEIRRAVRAGLAELIEGDDPRAAVIACWLRLEELAERGGVPRSPADAPGDLVARMLDGRLTAAAERALADLTGVYRAARYAPHEVPESARDTARSALDRLGAELSVRDGVPS